MKTDYLEKANNFLMNTNSTMQIKYLRYGKHFADDTDCRDIYRVTLKRGNEKFSFNFGQSIQNTCRKIAPNTYDILSCLQKYDVGSFNDFCGEFGYNNDSRITEKAYKAVCREYENLCRLYSPREIELMQNIF